MGAGQFSQYETAAVLGMRIQDRIPSLERALEEVRAHRAIREAQTRFVRATKEVIKATRESTESLLAVMEHEIIWAEETAATLSNVVQLYRKARELTDSIANMVDQNMTSVYERGLHNELVNANSEFVTIVDQFLDAAERAHPEYQNKLEKAFTSAFSNTSPNMTHEEFCEWLEQEIHSSH